MELRGVGEKYCMGRELVYKLEYLRCLVAYLLFLWILRVFITLCRICFLHLDFLRVFLLKGQFRLLFKRATGIENGILGGLLVI